MKKRKPWLAFLFSLVCPGLGQLYNGNLRIPAIAFVLSVMLALVMNIYLFGTLKMLAIAIGIGFVIDIVFAIHAYVEAKRLGEVQLRPFQRWWAYLLFIVVLYGLPDGYGFLMPTRFQSYEIPSESMVPTLLVGDRLVADGWAFWRKEPKAGEIVVFDYPRDPSIKYVKRLVGMPGDVVEMRDGVLYVNAQKIEQTNPVPDGDYFTVYQEEFPGNPHALRRSKLGGAANFAPVTVPADSYFMVGDNRDRSSDSRVWGFVKRKELLARMAFVYFSRDPVTGKIRWDRIGAAVN